VGDAVLTVLVSVLYALVLVIALLSLVALAMLGISSLIARRIARADAPAPGREPE
jgi:hypothetical protein